jgi:hypothetical protein
MSKDEKMWLTSYELYGRFGNFTLNFPKNCLKIINRFRNRGIKALNSLIKKKIKPPCTA